jgi:hypothetical protein
VKHSSSLDFGHIELFRNGLASGYIPVSISGLLSARFQTLEKEMIEKRETLEKMLTDIKENVTNFFKIELDADIVTQSLDSELVSAYIVTAAGRGSLMEVFSHLDDAIADLAQENRSMYEGLLLTEEGPVAGKNTRIGIVPFGMTFDQFAPRFHNVMSHAVAKHVSVTNEDPKLYAYNLVKINPSESAFRHRIPGTARVDKNSETYPINVIKGLMIKYLSPVKNLEIMASVRSKVPETVAMRVAVTTLIDTQCSLLVLTSDKIGRIVSGRQELLNKMKNRDFDSSLFMRYNTKTLTEFAKHIHGMLSVSKEDEVVGALKKDISSVVKNIGSRLGEDDLSILTKSIFNATKRIGSIINM